MGVFFVYILKSAICLALFYLFYRLLLSRETFHRFNRLALLGLLVASCAVPLIEVSADASTEISRQFLGLEEMLMMAEVSTIAEEAAIPTWSWREVLLLVYLLGILFFLVRNLWSLGRMYGLIDGCKKSKLDDGVLLFTHQKTITPFSWMKCIVMSEKDLDENGAAILTHERAHIANRHSWDLLLADLCVFFQWFNPAAWLLKQELQNIHEFEADEWVINQGIDAKTYQLLLIKKAVGTRLYSMANNLNHSNLKKRITMMIKKKSNPWARLKYLYVLPLAAVAVAAFARPEISNEFNEISRAKVSDLASVMKADAEKSAENLSDKKKKVKVSGRVIDENKQPVVGVSVLVRGTSNGTLAGDEGKFSIEAYEGDVLMFSYVGLQSQSVIVPKSGTKEMDVMLLPDVQSLDEVTVVSYPVHGSAELRTEATPSASGEDELIFEIVEELPEFPGGMQAMMAYIAKNIRYPAKAHEANVQGRVITQFTVGRDGSIHDAKIMRSVSPELDAEALRVIKSMPNWKPGKQRGKAVASRFTIPIIFRLDEPKDPSIVSAVSLKIDGDVPMGTVNDVKEHLRKGYRTKINYELGDTLSTEGGLQFRGNSQSALIVVDGVEKGYGTESLNAVSPADIAAITVLKPANAIAAYGEKAKDGAILITTKKDK